MTPLEVYQYYVALKNHFHGQLDFFKYGIRNSRIGDEQFERRHDKPFFYRLAKKYDKREIQNLFIANFSQQNVWVGDLNEQEAIAIWKQWEKNRQSFGYKFEQELDLITKKDIIVENGEHPRLLTKHLHGEVSLETICVLDLITGLVKYWDNDIEDKYIWPVNKRKIEKYRPFVERLFDVRRCKQIVRRRGNRRE